MSSERIKIFKPDTFSTFEKTLGKNRNGLEEFTTQVAKGVSTSVNSFDSSRYIPKRVVPNESVDIVLTSPPYGDSSTTVAYGQFSALANQWLGYMEKGRTLDNQLMGGKKASRLHTFQSDTLNDQIREIDRVDRSRTLDVVSFYKDYFSSIRNVSEKVKPLGFACYVVSNRTVRGTRLETGQITRDFFEANGFNHIETLSRTISNKRMPKKNSSTGVKGEKTSLMNKELIVVMQKQ
jgi:site-specific DNA-methyltransferase (cytosine-N4-specific)